MLALGERGSAAPRTHHRIYLDYQATTPCDPRVVEAMLPYFTEAFGNAASRTHPFGWEAENALEAARSRVASLIGASSREIIFTSGATESNNLAIRGTLLGHRQAGRRGDHIVTCRTEHLAVLDPCRALRREGWRVTELDVRGDGRIDLDVLTAALEPDTVLISLMHANNEIGVLQDLASVGAIARQRGVLLHSDAAQSVGKVSVDVNALGVDLLSLSAHKLYGPKGVGALYIRRQRPAIPVQPLLYGGGHERGLRSGTVAVPLCVGFGEACRLADQDGADEAERIGKLRDALLQGLRAELSGVHLLGDIEHRLPGNLCIAFDRVQAEALLLALPNLALSSGSACTSARRQPSHVLRALGVSKPRALGAIRVGLGRFTTAAEMDSALGALVDQVRRLRASRPAQDSRAGAGR